MKKRKAITMDSMERIRLKTAPKKRLQGHLGEASLIGVLPLVIAAVVIWVVSVILTQINQVATANSLAWQIFWPFTGNDQLTVADYAISVLRNAISTSTALGFLTWWRGKPISGSPLKRGLIAFTPRYVGGLTIIFIINTLLNDVLLIPMQSKNFLLLLVLLVLAIFLAVVQLGLSQSFYIYMDLRDNGTGGIWRALVLSWQLMSGFKWFLFVLQLSFIGWTILELFVIPIFYAIPYQQLTYALFYERLREIKPELVPDRNVH
jgi:uncharacterized membrane protein